jgi:hypothetical protein
MGELQPSLMHYDDYPMNSRQLRKNEKHRDNKAIPLQFVFLNLFGVVFGQINKKASWYLVS